MTRTAIPIRRTLMRMVLLSSGAVLAVTTLGFCTYEFLTFRQTSIQQLEILSQAIASNSTAALAFDNAEDAASVLSAFKADPHIVAAALYDAHGKLFASFPRRNAGAALPARPGVTGYTFGRSALAGYQPVLDGPKMLGTLYVQSDLGAMYARMRLYALIVMLVIGVSLPLAYLISRRLQHRLLIPILRLADTARAVSVRNDYTVRAARTGAYEFDMFTDTFNQMLTQIQASEGKLRDQLSRLSLLQQITRATGERQDLPSIFQVVLGSLEGDLPIDFGCFLIHDAGAQTLTVSALGIAGRRYADRARPDRHIDGADRSERPVEVRRRAARVRAGCGRGALSLSSAARERAACARSSSRRSWSRIRSSACWSPHDATRRPFPAGNASSYAS